MRIRDEERDVFKKVTDLQKYSHTTSCGVLKKSLNLLRITCLLCNMEIIIVPTSLGYCEH